MALQSFTMPMHTEINQFFKKAQDDYGIQSKELAQRLKISRNHLSEFRNGKSNITLDLLWQMLLVMDEIAPGSRAYTCQLMAGNIPMRQAKTTDRPKSLEELIDVATDQEIYYIMLKIADRWNSLTLSNYTNEEKSLVRF